MRYLWVVEILIGKKWEPTVGVSLDRHSGRIELHRWRVRNKSDKFRLVKYGLEAK